MTISRSNFLPGVPLDFVRAALAVAGGNEIESGKLDNPESSAALAINAFGWFVNRPGDLPQGNRIWNFLDGECFGLRDSAEMDSTSER